MSFFNNVFIVYRKMFRITLSKALSLPSTPILRLAPCNALCRGFADKAPEKIEVFIDDKPVYVLPGTTVLQVCKFIIVNILIFPYLQILSI